MERRKSRGSNLDELATVKAAAWAWYRHGSGTEGRPIREYDLGRTQKPPKPSRYKLEAMKQESSPLLSLPSGIGAENTDVSLLDTYEIERISRQLDYYIESSRAEYLKSFLDGENGNRRNGRVVSLSESGTSEKRSKPKNTSKRFGLVVCGSRHDVVETIKGGRSVSFRDSRWPEKNVVVVKSASCLPRGVHAK